LTFHSFSIKLNSSQKKSLALPLLLYDRCSKKPSMAKKIIGAVAGGVRKTVLKFGYFTTVSLAPASASPPRPFCPADSDASFFR
jgi:hypothetical protein